jgi:peptide/nickel transport system substrate-binding protein
MTTPFRKLAPVTFLAAATLVVLTACSAGGTAAVSSSKDGKPVSGGTIVYAAQQEPPCVFGGWIEEAYVSYNVLDNLFALDADQKVVPWLATGFEVSADGLSYTIHLKPNVKFTDGTPVDAAAIAYNFENWVGPNSSNSTANVWLHGYYQSATAVDATTLKIQLAKPYTNFIKNLTQAYFGIQSEQALKTRTAAQNCEAPIGSGAFTVSKWNHGQDLILKRNPNYTSPPATAKHTGPAYADEIDWKFVPDGLTRVAALQAGETDLVYDVPAAEWDSLKSAGYRELRYVTQGRPQQITFNTTAGRVFSDENLRKAFIYSLDRQKAVKTIGLDVLPYEGNGSVSQSTPGYSQKAADAYDTDVAKANQLLDAAGWTKRDSAGYRTKNGKTLEVVFPFNSGTIITQDGANILQALQEQAKKTGFKVDLIPVPAAETWAGKYSTPDSYDLSAGYWTAVSAGILQITWRPSTTNDPNYSNSAFYNDEALEKIIVAANSEADVTKQNALYEQAQEYIADKALAFGVYDRISDFAIGSKLKGFEQEESQGGPYFYDAYLAN